MFFGGGGRGGFPGMDDGDFGGFPGMPGMGGGGRRPNRKPADTTKFYKLLEVEKTASPDVIRKAYRKMAVKHHPDKGGDVELFKEMTKAYEVLSDENKRRRYDEGGEEAVSGEGGGGDPSDLFDMMFGGQGGRGGGQRQRKKTKDVVHNLGVTLEQLYNGATKKIAVSRDVLEKGAVKECSECDGRGVKIQIIRMGPMIQQAQAPCGACGGVGKTFKCKKEREILEVFIEKGCPSGHKITFSGKADEHPDADPGDVVFTIGVKDHPRFHRKHADLYVHKTISLREALCGYTLEVEHLDGRKLLIKSNEGSVTQPMLFDPLQAEANSTEWECISDMDSPGDHVAQAETTDVDACKKVCAQKGFTCFVVQDGSTHFKQCTRAEALASKKPKNGSMMYVIRDPNETQSLRLCKAVKGEGMPTHKNPFVFGNMFLILKIEFPAELGEDAIKLLAQALPPPINVPKLKDDDPNVEIHYTEDMDPVVSMEANKHNVQEAYDEDEDQGGGPGGQRVQCNQQ